MHATDMSVAKVIGADFELANALIGPTHGSARQAAGSLLAEIRGYPRSNRGGTSIEYGRRFLATCGSSWYIDSDHLEGNLPEHCSALDHANILHGAGFQQARHAMRVVQMNLPTEMRLNLLANCSDGHTSWGSHLNIMLSRRCFNDIVHRKPYLAGFFATHLVTSVLYTGQGLVGAANGRSPCTYQLSQRADWFEQFANQQTMYDRPLINTRDESHAEESLARFHIIYLDMVLSPVANILKAGTTQLVLAMIEASRLDPTLCLDDPIEGASEISRDLQLNKQLRTVVRGRRMTALEMQQAMADLAGEFVASGAAAGIVPDAELIVALWQETLELLRQRDLDALARRCDAWLKYLLLDRQRGRNQLSWSSDKMRVADSLFASLDPELSLFFQVAESGFVERMPEVATLERFQNEPPDDTRAYFRAHVLRHYGDDVSSMNWSRMTFRVPGARHWWSTADVPLGDPRRFNRLETEALFDKCKSLEELVEAANSLPHQLPIEYDTRRVVSAERNGEVPDETSTPLNN